MNYLNVLNYGNDFLKLNNIKSHNLDSELLLAKVLNLSREDLLINLEKKIDNINIEGFQKLLNRRKNKEPIAYIFNNKEFWKYNFVVNKYVLIPRPETEIIIDEVLKLTNINSSKQFLDIGTGSGCIILSIIKERPKSYGTALDVSKKALKVAIYNAKMHHLENKIKFINMDVDKYHNNKYDFIVSNPPYIDNAKLKRLDDDVRLFEPHVALEAGIDGLSEIRKVIFRSKKLLKINGKLILEIGVKQLVNVMKILNRNSFYVNKICNDLRSLPRVIIATKLI